MKTQAGSEPTKHTPGPWTASLAYGGGTAIWIAPQDGVKMVLQGAQCLRSDTIKYEQISVDQLDANATLIAASPDLLDALKASKQALAAAIEALAINEEAAALCEQAEDIADRAIAKATGVPS